MKFKNSRNYNDDPLYTAGLIKRIQEKHNLSLRQVALQIGVSYSTLRYWVDGEYRANYPGQYILENLLASESVEVIKKSV